MTNGQYKGDIPVSQSISGYTVFYRIIDIDFLYKISEQSRVPIELDFDNLDGRHFEIPCLSANIENPDYEAYIAIIPGECLATLYHNYGARLLEQNVRSFLQFTGKINKGIRKTINEEPHMFLALITVLQLRLIIFCWTKPDDLLSKLVIYRLLTEDKQLLLFIIQQERIKQIFLKYMSK